MDIAHAITLFTVLLLLALAAHFFAHKTRLPFTLWLVLIGFVGAEMFIGLGGDTGLRHTHFQGLIFFVFLPILIFEAAYRIDIAGLLKYLSPVLVLAVLGMLLTAVITAVGLFIGINHPGFPWMAALITGALLAATDPVAVIAQLKTSYAPKRITLLLEGESLFNDATAVVLFTVFVSLALMPAQMTGVSDIVLRFLYVALGGAIIGALLGYFTAFFACYCSPLFKVILTLVLAYSSYLLAELVWEVSGVMAVLLAGLMFARFACHQDNTASFEKVNFFWDSIGFIANALVFLLVGIIISLPMFQERWLAMLIAIVSLLIARCISVCLGLSLYTKLTCQPAIPATEQTVMVWGGLRGAIVLALALSLPTSLDYWWTIQSIAFGVVVFTLFVQAPLMPLLLNKFFKQK